MSLETPTSSLHTYRVPPNPNLHHSLTLTLPDWVQEEARIPDLQLNTPEERMDFAIRLSRRNVQEGTGGPFGSIIVNRESGALIAVGVNIVVPGKCSAAHAEIMTMCLAQQALGSHDLSAEGLPPCELITSTEPCSMCLGAVLWSGITRLVCGARHEDAEEVGFDEGPKPGNWEQELAKRGIETVRDILRSEAVAVLQQYGDGGSPIYNSKRSD